MALSQSIYTSPTPSSNTKSNPTIPSSKIYKGFSTVNRKTANPSIYDLDLIKQDLINQFNVRQGELLGDPEFGTIIWNLIMDPLTDQVKNAITQNVTAIINYDPRIKVNSVSVTEYESGIQVACSLTYLTYNISDQLMLTFDQNIGLS